MKRNTVRLLSLLVWGLLGAAVVSACASDEALPANNLGGSDASTDGRPCDPGFCAPSGMGTGCCLSASGPCGVDFGMGCVQKTPDAG